MGFYAWGSGTSMAAPHVSGIVGLVYAENPTWTYQQVRTQVIDTARPVASLAGKTVSGGVVDAAAALGVDVPPPPPPGCGDELCDQGETLCDCPEDCGDPPLDETGLCDDGEDNDCDGATDCDDADCAADPACVCIPTENPEESCSDGIDNDCDGDTDCDDTDCDDDPACACSPKNASCLSNEECCSGICKNNGRCR